jgi:hypothetical protein
MQSLATDYQQKQLKDSGLVDQLFGAVHVKLAACSPLDLACVMDACARLCYRPTPNLLAVLQSLCRQQALQFSSTQLPMVLWGFASLSCALASSTQEAFDAAILHQAANLNPQGVSLTLWSLAKLLHTPKAAVLDALAANLRDQMELYKPHELANTIEALVALKYTPSNDILAAITGRLSRSIDASATSGRSLGDWALQQIKPPLSGVTKSTKTSSGVVLPGTEHLRETLTKRVYDASPAASFRAAPVMLKL